MVYKLFGYPVSTNTKRTALMFHEKNIPFEFHPVDLVQAEHKNADYLTKQPFAQVPYINDDGFVLFESRAICRYLEAKYPDRGTKLIPSDIRERALFEQGASIESTNFDTLVTPLVWELFFKERFGLTPDQARVDELKKTLAAKLDIYEEILSKQKYIGGDSITLADLFHLPYGSMLPLSGVHFIQERPHVAKWFSELEKRPSWQAVKDGVKSSA